MLPILTKPLIHYGVDEALEAGMENMGFVTGRGKRALEDYFDISYELEHQISGTKKNTYLMKFALWSIVVPLLLQDKIKWKA